MATKSILKSINIRTRNAAELFARAMEKAYAQKVVPVKMSRPVSDASEKDIRGMFAGQAK